MALAASGQEVDRNSARLAKSEMALEALRNILKNDPGYNFYQIKVLTYMDS